MMSGTAFLTAQAAGPEVENLGLYAGLLLLLALGLLLGTLAYVMVGARRVDLQFVVRVGSQASHRRAGFRIALLAAAALIMAVMLWLVNPGEELPVRTAIVVLGAAATAAAINWCWNRVLKRSEARLVESQRMRALAAEARRELRGCFAREKLVELAARKVSAALYVPEIITYLDEQGVYRPAHALPGPVRPELVFNAASLMIRTLERAPRRGLVEIGPETAILRHLGFVSQALAPLWREDRLAGFWILGERRPAARFSQEETWLLAEMGRELAECLEWSGTVTAYASGRAAAARQDEARVLLKSVKTEMFHGERFEAPGLEFAGSWSAAGTPECECYAFLPLPQQDLGFLMARTRGDAVSAALRLARLQGWLRGRADVTTGDLSRELERLRAAAKSGEGLDLFLARYEWRTQQLRYLNAGYPAPFVLRRTGTGGSVLRLSAGATVAANATEGQFGLLPGDLVIAASQGLVKGNNAAGQEWGEGALIETVMSWQGQRAQDITDLTLRTACSHAAEGDPAQDQAVVVLRVKTPEGANTGLVE